MIEMKTQVRCSIRLDHAAIQRSCDWSNEIRGSRSCRTSEANTKCAEVPSFHFAGPGNCNPPKQTSYRKWKPGVTEHPTKQSDLMHGLGLPFVNLFSKFGERLFVR